MWQLSNSWPNWFSKQSDLTKFQHSWNQPRFRAEIQYNCSQVCKKSPFTCLLYWKQPIDTDFIPLVTHISVSETSHVLVMTCHPWGELQWNLYQNTMVFMEKIHLKMSSAKWLCSFRFNLNVLLKGLGYPSFKQTNITPALGASHARYKPGTGLPSW